MKSAWKPYRRLTRWSPGSWIVLGVAVPVFLLFTILALALNYRARGLLEEQLILSTLQAGEIMLSSLRQAMLESDFDSLAQILSNVGGNAGVENAQIVGLTRRVVAESSGRERSEIGEIKSLESGACAVCHRFPNGAIPRAVKAPESAQTLQVALPIANEPACQECHPAEHTNLGVLLLDVSLEAAAARTNASLQMDLIYAAAGALGVTVLLIVLLQVWVFRRVEAFLERTAERTDIQQRAITSERERIARDLHDGMAQLLGYINTKAMAVRLLLKDRDLEAADEQLAQFEETTRELYEEAREAILGLNITAEPGQTFADRLRGYIDRFSSLSGMPVDVDMSPGIGRISLPGETELHLLRIVQESLTNVQNHASADKAWLAVSLQDSVLELTVSDNGVGFEPGRDQNANRPGHFGLGIMQERADAIGATLQLESKPGAGTRLIVQLALGEG